MKGLWTLGSGGPLPSSHQVAAGDETALLTRCGRTIVRELATALLNEPPATGKTCESCLRLALKDAIPDAPERDDA